MGTRVADKSRWRLSPVQRSEVWWGVVFLAPMVILTLVFVVYPIFGSLHMALYNWQGIGRPSQFVGLRHFVSVAKDPWFWNAFKNTIIYTIGVVPTQFFFAIMLAMLLNNPKLRFSNFYRLIYFVPVIANVAIIAVVLRLMLGNFGIGISKFLGIHPPMSPIGSPQLAMPSVIAFGTWQTFGIIVVYYMAALQTVPEELYDAAKVDGADVRQRIWHVTLPCIRPILVVMLFLSIMGSLRVFPQSFVLTRGGPYYASEVVSGYIFTYAFGGTGRDPAPANMGYANAAAFFFSLVTLTITIIQGIIVQRVRQKHKEKS